VFDALTAKLIVAVGIENGVEAKLEKVIDIMAFGACPRLRHPV